MADGVRDERDLEDGRMPFLSHLVELRDRLRNAALVFLAACIGCWYFSKQIFAWLREPLFDIWNRHCNAIVNGVGDGPTCVGINIPPEQSWGAPKLIYTGLTQPFWVDMSIAMWAGIFVASPMIFYQLWKFIAPGLYKRERRLTISFSVFSAIFFCCGALFCFYVALPKLYDFLLSYNSRDLRSLPNIQEYLDLTRDMMLAFGAIFELPLLIYFLAIAGVVTHRSLWKFSRWFVVIAFATGAILTPGPDVMSQIMMAAPMIVLYNVSILLAWRVTKKREAKAQAEAAQEAEEP